MSIKDYIKQTTQSFFIVVTLINAAMMILGRFFDPANQQSYMVFGYPLLYGFCSMIPSFILYSSKELSIKALLVRKLLHMLLIVVLLVLFVFGFHGICMENAEKIAGVCASVMVIYVLEGVISWFVNTHDAARLTESLHKYQAVRECNEKRGIEKCL